jgi:carboxypeptidase PM20D1
MKDGDDPAGREFLSLHRYLERSFPLIYSRCPPEEPGGYGLLFRLPGGDPSLKPLLMVAHQDVVPEGDPEDWTRPPFGGEVAKGRVWGRGAVDYKIGLCGMMEAVERLLAAGAGLRRGLILAFGHDEETGGAGGAERITSLLEREGVRCLMSLDEGGYVYDYPWAGRPVAVIAVAEKGYATVALTGFGTQGHASVPPADLALAALSRAVCRLVENPMPPVLCPPVARLVERTSKAPDPLAARALEELAGWPEANALLRTTAAPTVLEGGSSENVLPSRARALVNFRTVPGQTSGDVMEHVRGLVSDLPVRAELVRDASLSEPSRVSPDSGPLWDAVADSVRAGFRGLEVLPGVFPAATDSRRYSRVCDAVYRFVPARLGPRGIRMLHSVDESVAVEDYLSAVEFYGALVKRLCL